MMLAPEHGTPCVSFRSGDEHAFGKDFVHFNHAFAESGLFTDDKLAELIENYPREYYVMATVRGEAAGSEWLHGDFKGLPGAFVLEAIKTGRLWLNLRRLDLIAPDYDRLVTDAFAEIEALNPSLKTSRQKSSILISSPGARVLYHADIPMIALWHIRGRKRVWLYDADNKDMLPDETLEAVILREQEEDIPYDPAWDARAKAIDLDPGTVISWPHNAPHRVDNLEGLNVSITTDFFTPAATRKYGVYYTNGIIRRRLGLNPRSTAIEGPGALAKCAAAIALKKAGIQRTREHQMVQVFRLDRARPGEIIDLAPDQRRPIAQA